MIQNFDCEIPEKSKAGTVHDDVMEFAASPSKTCEVAVKTNANTTVSTYYNAVKRLKRCGKITADIKCVCRGDKVYMIKEG